jgi:hypothetical protein
MSTPRSDELFKASPDESAIPADVDRRSFLMRNAVIGAAAAMTGASWTPKRGLSKRPRKPRNRKSCSRLLRTWMS